MLVECRKVAPILFEKAGPDCVAKGICKEGKMSCGILPKVKAYQAENREVAVLFLPDNK
jgi:thymidylate synthase (FAD)